MLKSIFSIIGLLFFALNVAQAQTTLCSKEANSAACPLELLGPEPDIIPSVECDSNSQIVTYTVKSHIPHDVDFDSISIVPLIDLDTSPDSQVNIIGGSCISDGFVPGLGECEIIVEIIPTDQNCVDELLFPQIIARRLLVEPNINQDLFADIVVEVTTGAPYLVTISGSQGPSPTTLNSVSDFPLLVVHDADGTWKNVTLPFAEIGGIFNSSTCSGNNDDSMCLAAGERDGDTFLYVSYDGGLHWSEADIDDFPRAGVLYGVTCFNDDNCQVVGHMDDPIDDLGINSVNAGAIILSTTDGGDNWAVTGSDDFTADAALFTTACGDDGCFSTGADPSLTLVSSIQDPEGFSFLVTEDGDILYYPAATTFFLDSACSESVCLTVGQSQPDLKDAASPPPPPEQGFMLVSTDSFSTGYYSLFFSDVAIFEGTACTSVDGQIVCIAVGVTQDGKPIVYVNNHTANDPSNWVAGVSSISPGALGGAACQTSGSDAVCIATGLEGDLFGDPEDMFPLILKGTFNGSSLSWDQESVPSGNGFLIGACTESPLGNIVCTAAGKNTVTDAPLLFVNTDTLNNNNWGARLTQPALPIQACFSNAGASGSSTGSFLYPIHYPTLGSVCQ